MVAVSVCLANALGKLQPLSGPAGSYGWAYEASEAAQLLRLLSLTVQVRHCAQAQQCSSSCCRCWRGGLKSSQQVWGRLPVGALCSSGWVGVGVHLAMVHHKRQGTLQ
jgi:hypothetical protein